MSTPAELHAAVLAALQTMSTVTVYDGVVPKSLPADGSGRVYPYAVVWSGAGAPPDPTERDVAALPGGTGLAWTTQVTVASGTPGWTLAAIPLVRQRLHLVEIIPGVRLEEELGDLRIQEDRDTDPSRWFAPLPFRALTP